MTTVASCFFQLLDKNLFFKDEKVILQNLKLGLEEMIKNNG